MPPRGPAHLQQRLHHAAGHQRLAAGVVAGQVVEEGEEGGGELVGIGLHGGVWGEHGGGSARVRTPPKTPPGAPCGPTDHGLDAVADEDGEEAVVGGGAGAVDDAAEFRGPLQVHDRGQRPQRGRFDVLNFFGGGREEAVRGDLGKGKGWGLTISCLSVICSTSTSSSISPLYRMLLADSCKALEYTAKQRGFILGPPQNKNNPNLPFFLCLPPPPSIFNPYRGWRWRAAEPAPPAAAFCGWRNRAPSGCG